MNLGLLEMLKNVKPRDLLLYIGIYIAGDAGNRLNENFWEGFIMYLLAGACFVVSSYLKVQKHEEVEKKLEHIEKRAENAEEKADQAVSQVASSTNENIE